MTLHVEAFTFNDSSSLSVTAKRYTISNSDDNKNGLTLLFTHCIGAHKEQWEPAIEDIFNTQRTKDAYHCVREAWAFDWQSHGDAALINEAELRKRLPLGVSVFELAKAIASFVSSPRMKGHRIVPMGHSGGASAVVLSTRDLPSSTFYTSLILIEPMIVSRELYHQELADRTAEMKFAVESTLKRRREWKTRDEAHAWMKKRLPFISWDERVLKKYVEYGLYPISSTSVALKTRPETESATFQETEASFTAFLQLCQISHLLPVHIIWGAKEELIEPFIAEALSDPKQGCVSASVRKVQDAGHLVVQEKPTGLAEAICSILDNIPSDLGRAKL